MEESKDYEEMEELQFLKLGQDYFSYALFAFYIFDEDEKMLQHVQTRFTMAAQSKHSKSETEENAADRE